MSEKTNLSDYLKIEDVHVTCNGDIVISDENSKRFIEKSTKSERIKITSDGPQCGSLCTC